MKFKTWNIRGLNNPRKKRILKNKLRKEQPDLCFIQETECVVDRMETINKKQWRKYKMLVVEGQQMAGSILTLWNPQVMNLLAVEATRHTLSVNMQIIGNTKVILCTNVYGPQMLEEKRRPKSQFQQPPLDPCRGLQHHHDTCREKRRHQEI